MSTTTNDKYFYIEFDFVIDLWYAAQEVVRLMLLFVLNPLTFSGLMRNSGTCDRSLSNSCCVRGRAVDKSSTTLVSARGASRSSSRKRAMEQQTSCRCQPCGEGAQELEEVPDSVDRTTRRCQSSKMILNRSALRLRTNGQIQREIINSR
jgi:hypothetical protein